MSDDERDRGYPSFWKVLQRCYYHEVKFDDLESIFSVYEVSDFLQMNSLMNTCVTEMMKVIPTNCTDAASKCVLKLLEFSALYVPSNMIFFLLFWKVSRCYYSCSEL